MKKTGFNIIIHLLILLPLLASCRQELCYDHFPAVDVALSWEREWERDYGMLHSENWDKDYYGYDYESLRPEVPGAITMLRTNDEGISTESYLTPSGGEVIVELSDKFSFLIYNNDTEYIVLSDIASLTNARATTTSRTRGSISFLEAKHPGTRSMNPPDAFYASYLDNVDKVNVHEMRHLPVKMQPLVYTYLVRYEFDNGLEYVELARGALAGMAESVYLHSGRTSDESAILLYDCELTSYGCEAKVGSFGIPGFPDEYYGKKSPREADHPYTLNLEILLKNGNVLEYNFDVSDQIAKQPRGGVITVSGISIKKEDAQYAAGFDVDLNDWGKHEDIELPVSAVPDSP